MKHAKKKAFTLVEIIIAIMVVSIGLTATMRLVPLLLQSVKASRHIAVSERLSFDLLAEMDLLPFQDPETAGVGLEAGESSVSRALYDDIDDYDDYTEMPPCARDGTALTGVDAYRRSVTVQSVSTAGYTSIVADGTSNAKLITITITCEGMPPYVLSTVRLKGIERSP